MQKKRNISGRFLLATYLLVAFNCNFSHNHLALFDISCEASHSHDEFETVHHEHGFHIGIFHFLGHILEELRHLDNDDFGDEHLVNASDNQFKKPIESNKTSEFSFGGNQIAFIPVDEIFLTSPPEFSPFPIQILIKSDTPLRAPPSFV